MKKEKGVTLIALIVYVIALVFVIGGMASITGTFRSTINEVDVSTESVASFTKLNMYLLKDLKTVGTKIQGDITDAEFSLLVPTSSSSEIVRYSFQNGCIYRNNVKICENLQGAVFGGEKTVVSGETGTITIKLKIKGYEKTTTYALEKGVAV